jgi:hypothetical protein
MEQLLFLLLVGLVALVKWFVERAARGGTADPPSPTPRPRRSAPVNPQDAETERIRKFMEALGMPAENVPPPPIRRRVAGEGPPVVPPRVPRQVGPTVRRKVVPPLVPPPIHVPAKPEPPPAPVIHQEPVEPAPGLDRPLAPERVPEIATGRKAVEMAELRALLGSPAGIRAAFVAREVLGPPGGLQSTF